MFILQVITYIATTIFIVANAYKFYRIATAPVHLRWELYPIPNDKSRSSYGGSKMEETESWNIKDKKNRTAQLIAMFKEVLFMTTVREKNPKLWAPSLMFHWGLYFIIANIALTGLSVIMVILGVHPFSQLFQLYYELVRIIVITGSVIGITGAVRLLLLRIFDKSLNMYSNPSHYLNIILIGSIYGTTLIWLWTDPYIFGHFFTYYFALITLTKYVGLDLFRIAIPLPLAGYVHICVVLLFMIYLPFTHMTHFFTKYFTYHKVRWDDAENIKGTKINIAIEEQLKSPVSWSASHIAADGMKSWIAVVNPEVTKGDKQ